MLLLLKEDGRREFETSSRTSHVYSVALYSAVTNEVK